MKELLTSATTRQRWVNPINLDLYDRNPQLSDAEYYELGAFARRMNEFGKKEAFRSETNDILSRLLCPILDVTRILRIPRQGRALRYVLLQAMHNKRKTFWAWTEEEWQEIVRPPNPGYIAIVGYILCGHTRLRPTHQFNSYCFCCYIFGKDITDESIDRAIEALTRIGYIKFKKPRKRLLSEIFLLNQSPYLEDITLDLLEEQKHGSLPG